LFGRSDRVAAPVAGDAQRSRGAAKDLCTGWVTRHERQKPLRAALRSRERAASRSKLQLFSRPDRFAGCTAHTHATCTEELPSPIHTYSPPRRGTFCGLCHVHLALLQSPYTYRTRSKRGLRTVHGGRIGPRTVLETIWNPRISNSTGSCSTRAIPANRPVGHCELYTPYGAPYACMYGRFDPFSSFDTFHTHLIFRPSMSAPEMPGEPTVCMYYYSIDIAFRCSVKLSAFDSLTLVVRDDPQSRIICGLRF